MRVLSQPAFWAAETNKPVTRGPFAEDFEREVGKWFFLGVPVERGSIWKAKGTTLCTS